MIRNEMEDSSNTKGDDSVKDGGKINSNPQAEEENGGEYRIRWNQFGKHACLSFSELYYLDELHDVSLCCGGEISKAHKVVLATCSSFFKKIFQETPSKHPIILIKDVSFEMLQHVLRFIYFGEVSLEEHEIESFNKAAEYLEIKNFQTKVKSVFKVPPSQLTPRTPSSAGVGTVPLGMGLGSVGGDGDIYRKYEQLLKRQRTPLSAFGMVPPRIQTFSEHSNVSSGFIDGPWSAPVNGGKIGRGGGSWNSPASSTLISPLQTNTAFPFPPPPSFVGSSNSSVGSPVFTPATPKSATSSVSRTAAVAVGQDENNGNTSDKQDGTTHLQKVLLSPASDPGIEQVSFPTAPVGSQNALLNVNWQPQKQQESAVPLFGRNSNFMGGRGGKGMNNYNRQLTAHQRISQIASSLKNRQISANANQNLWKTKGTYLPLQK